MDDIKLSIHSLDIAEHFKAPLLDVVLPWKLKTFVDILVVVDTEIATAPGSGFGVGSVIELVRAAHVGCMRFRIDIALRSNQPPSVVAAPGPYQPKYRGFRFDMTDGGTSVLTKYEQIWCFGFKPSNSGSGNDAEIDQAFAMPASNAELAVLSAWMDDGGGLFGTGDHHFLGASMLRKVPRLGTMRRWTNATGVPPIGTPSRIDTLRPPSPAYMPGAPGGPLPLSNGAHQGDGTPQPIRWVTWQRSSWPIAWKKRPHPVLCHPTLGPINVMPDHAHEGLCIEQADIDEARTFNFDGGGAKPEYPDATAGGPKPLPHIIAYGSTLGDPPYNFAKFEQPARASFPMISVYDGHLAGVGRVATDSNWHHWFDDNLVTLKANNDDNWKKISRYFINLAVWLNPPGFSTNCLYLSAIASHFETPGFQEYQDKLPTRVLGEALRHHLAFHYGPCWVTERIWWDIVWVRKLWPWEILRPIDKIRFDFGGVEPQIIEDLFLGSLVEETMKIAGAIKAAADKGEKRAGVRIGKREAFAAPGVDRALGGFAKEVRAHLEDTIKVLGQLER